MPGGKKDPAKYPRAAQITYTATIIAFLSPQFFNDYSCHDDSIGDLFCQSIVGAGYDNGMNRTHFKKGA
jgi:hypothetical protein